MHTIQFLFVFQTLKPDPILSLKRVVGFGGGTFREVNLSSLDDQHFSFSKLFALLLDVFKCHFRISMSEKFHGFCEHCLAIQVHCSFKTMEKVNPQSTRHNVSCNSVAKCCELS